MTFSIVNGNADGRFTISPSNGKITLASNGALDYETSRIHILTVRGETGDATNALLYDDARVTVNVGNVAEAPILHPSSLAVLENAATGSAVGSPIVAVDPDGSSITYSITSGATSDFEINSASGQITVKAGASLDYEDAGNRVKTVTVRASDSSLHAEAIITITILNVNEAPTIAATTVLTVNEHSPKDTAVGSPITATDPDVGSSLTYAITGYGNHSMGAFYINSQTGQ